MANGDVAAARPGGNVAALGARPYPLYLVSYTTASHGRDNRMAPLMMPTIE